MSKLINLVLLYGGKSGEHEISLISAASVLAHLDAQKYHIIPVAIDKDGLFHVHAYQDLLAYPDKLPVKTEQSKNLPNLFLNGRLAFDEEVDVVFPVIHGPLYEDGCLQGFLELADVAYVGCDVLSSSIGMDKDMSRRVACTEGLQSARYRLLSCYASAAARQHFCEEVAFELGWPLFVKPCAMGSSVGIHKAQNMQELVAAVEDALRFDEEVLVESFIDGREIEVAVLENAHDEANPKVSVVGEICVHHQDGFYSYAAKYLDSNQTDLIIPASLSLELMQKVQNSAAHVFKRLKCRGLARIDFFVNDKTQAIYFNEINTLPGFTSISMYPKLWEASGLSYRELLDELIYLAQRAYRSRQHLVTNYQ